MSYVNDEIKELEQSYDDVRAEFEKAIVEESSWVKDLEHRKLKLASAVSPTDVSLIRSKVKVAEEYEKSAREAGYDIRGGCKKMPSRLILDHQTQELLDSLVIMTDLEVSLVRKGSLKHTACLLEDKAFLEQRTLLQLANDSYFFWPAWLNPEAQNCPIIDSDKDIFIEHYMDASEALNVVDQIMQMAMVTGTSRGVKARLELYSKEVCMMQGNVFIQKLREWAESKRQTEGFYDPFIGHDKRKTPTIKPGTFSAPTQMDFSSGNEGSEEEKEDFIATPVPAAVYNRKVSSTASSFKATKAAESDKAKSELIKRMINEQNKSVKKKLKKSQRRLNFSATSVNEDPSDSDPSSESQ